jgi:uncharacterized protein (TIGR02246 family)
MGKRAEVKAMNIEQARALVEHQAQAWEQADFETIVADFASEGELISPGGRWQGAAAIRAAIEAFYEQAGEVKIEVSRVFMAGQQGAVEWTWSETRLADGQRYQVDDAIIFEVNEAGQLVYWREYFDTGGWRRFPLAEKPGSSGNPVSPPEK